MCERIKKILKFLLIFIIIASWIFLETPGALSVSLPATSFLSNTTSAKITSTVSWQIVTTAPATSDTTTSVKQVKTTGYFQWLPGVASTAAGQAATTTSPDGKGFIFDTALDSTIPAGTWTFNIKTTASSATGNGLAIVCAWKVNVAAGAITASSTIFASPCVAGNTNLMSSTSALASSVSVTGVAAQSFTSSQFLYVEYWLDMRVAGGSTTGKTTFEANAGAADDIVLPNASSNLSPNAPSQGSPANNATGVSATPTFLMTATDPETDNLGYKVTIYSNSGCTTVVQTNDQATSTAGWTGTNATCTNSPTSCYSSGTQGSFATQTALANSTQFWWKASAKDPDGSGGFTNSSTCNNFTTVAAASLTFTVDTSNVSFVSTITPGTPVSTSSVLTINTNNSSGYNIKINRASSTPTLILSADNATTISDTINNNNWTAPGSGTATTTAGPSAVWTMGITKGLGFRVKQTGTTAGAYHSTWWGADDTAVNAKYSGISTSTAAQIICNNNVGSGSNENITVGYQLDTATNQKSGIYNSSPVTYTAVTNP